MFNTLLEKNIAYLKQQKNYRNFDIHVKKAVNSLNKNSILTVSWLRHTGVSWFLSALLTKTQSLDSCFFYNSELDTLKAVKNKSDLQTLFDIYTRVHSYPKIIILQNTNNIQGIKSYISELYKAKIYKIILVWNNIKIEGVPNIEMYPLAASPENISESYFWGLPEVRIVPDPNYKDFLLRALRNDIILREIIEAYTVKNIDSLFATLGYLSGTQDYLSLREMHRHLKEHEIDISLLTMIDYINASLNTKILHRCYLYDIKNNNVISSKACYYFGDTGIRKSFDESYLLENLLYLELKIFWYNIYGWLNGRFQFDFRATKWERILSLALDNSKSKNEIRKTARKLEKIWDSSEKYVIVSSKEDLQMRKFQEGSVQIVTVQEFLELLRK